MARQLDFVGKTGTAYRYTALENDRIPPMSGANYVISDTGPESKVRVLFAGETENVMVDDLVARLQDIRRHWPAAELLLRLNVRRAVRLAERDDLVAAHLPPLNDSPEPPSATEVRLSPGP